MQKMRKAFTARSKHESPEIGPPSLKLIGARGLPCPIDLDSEDECFIQATKAARTLGRTAARDTVAGDSGSERLENIAVQQQGETAGPSILGGAQLSCILSPIDAIVHQVPTPPKPRHASPSESGRALKVARITGEVAGKRSRDECQAGHASADSGPAPPPSPPPPPPLPVMPRVSRSGGSSFACPRHGKNHRWTMLDPCLDCIAAAEQAML